MLSLPALVIDPLLLCYVPALNESRVRPIMYKHEFVGPILQLLQEHCPDVSPRSDTVLQWVWHGRSVVSQLINCSSVV